MRRTEKERQRIAPKCGADSMNSYLLHAQGSSIATTPLLQEDISRSSFLKVSYISVSFTAPCPNTHFKLQSNLISKDGTKLGRPFVFPTPLFVVGLESGQHFPFKHYNLSPNTEWQKVTNLNQDQLEFRLVPVEGNAIINLDFSIICHIRAE